MWARLSEGLNCAGLRAGTGDKAVLEVEEVKDVANTWAAGGVEVDGARITTHETVLEREKVEDVAGIGTAACIEFACARRASWLARVIAIRHRVAEQGHDDMHLGKSDGGECRGLVEIAAGRHDVTGRCLAQGVGTNEEDRGFGLTRVVRRNHLDDECGILANSDVYGDEFNKASDIEELVHG